MKNDSKKLIKRLFLILLTLVILTTAVWFSLPFNENAPKTFEASFLGIKGYGLVGRADALNPENVVFRFLVDGTEKAFSIDGGNVYSLQITDEEKNADCILRFKGKTINSQTLLGRMIKYGWDKGYAQDAGCFYEFIHTDISGIERKTDGTPVKTGYITELCFSGMYIGGFEVDAEEVEIEEVKIYDASSNNTTIKAGEINKRYFSEIINQLTAIIGSKE